ncbi:MAG: hypothetical protein HGA85_07285 [Nanoarchaeota archaeon]|nr:hypothetical protein [Nanoarchaeota archaeon]
MADYTSPFKTGIDFLDRLGVYEVLLPFLLIFTLVYAILEKSRAFGVENGQPKKNLNSMFAFVTAFLVVASSRLVAAINESIANMTILMLLGICFLLLAGVFHTGDKEMELGKAYKGIFMAIMFIGIVLIFLHAIKTNDGTPWLYYGWFFLVRNIDSGWVGAIILTLLVVGLMAYITGKPGGSGGEKKEG